MAEVKLDALDHPKTFDFASRLGVELPTALGHLELLWAFTGKQAAQGNIGKWPDGAIARACYWMGDPMAFIRALHESGFIDADPTHRFVVHDWRVHAPGWVRAKLKKLGVEFITSEPPSERSSVGSSEPSSDGGKQTSEPTSRAPVLKGREEKGSEGKSKTTLSAAPTVPERVRTVFDHWRTVHEHPQAQLGAKRRKVIEKALGLYPVDVLCESIAGYRNSSFHMGNNDRGQVYDDIALMLRDEKQIEQGLSFARAQPHPKLSALTRKNLSNTEDWVPPEMRRAAG